MIYQLVESTVKFLDCVFTDKLDLKFLTSQHMEENDIFIEKVVVLKRDGFIVSEQSFKKYDPELIEALKKICAENSIDHAHFPWQMSLNIDFDNSQEVQEFVGNIKLYNKIAEDCSFSVREITSKVLKKAKTSFDEVKGALILLAENDFPFAKLTKSDLKHVGDATCFQGMIE